MSSLFYHFQRLIEFKLLYSILGNSFRISRLKKIGVKIGENCYIQNNSYDTEPYLIEIGDHVAVASGVRFITHDGGVWALRLKYPDIDSFGKIKIGNNCFIGIDSIILPNTDIGNNCIIGAGTVIRGKIPDNSVVMGNPAKTIMKMSLLESMYIGNKNTLHIKNKSHQEKKEILLKHFNIPEQNK
jgi:acetyltransferase-like isoleucine patch superfamily enzyme